MKINEVINKLSENNINEIVTVGIYDKNGIRINRYLISDIFLKDQALEIAIDIENQLDTKPI
jgi:hypothetical protein